ncbi:MAG: hypothetical protein KAY32_14005 [Candidatus Eisenbacteria sp.]|nr:hypothetical protein [Candidatus Eisenbacteria bacterium]
MDASPRPDRPRGLRGPPARLPAGYARIWRLLSEENQHHASRQVLARSLRVSTQTIQRILVDGTAPDFHRDTNRRVRHAWTRTLARLANYFGHEPRAWLEAVGIPWNEEIRRIATRAIETAGREASPHAAGSRHPAGARAASASSRSPLPPLPEFLAAARAAEPSAVRDHIGIAAGGIFARPLYGSRESFLHTFARRVLGAVVPGAMLPARELDPERLAAALIAGERRLPIGIGLLDTVARRASGLAFTPIPGLRLHLAAVTLRDAREGRPPPSWSQATHPSDPDRTTFLVTAAGIAHDHLLGQTGLPPERLDVSDETTPFGLARELLAACSRIPARQTFLVCDEETCRATIRELQRNADMPTALAPTLMSDLPEEAPHFPLAIAYPERAPDWSHWFSLAIEHALLGSATTETAALYANLLAVSLFETPTADILDHEPAAGLWRPEAFAPVPEAFPQRLADHLLELLEEGLLAHQAGRREAGSPAELRRQVARATPMHAERLMPVAWRPALTSALKQRRAGESTYCRSCAISLGSPRHRGASDRYCRFCSDNRGELKPCDEVERILAAWMAHWVRSISPEEARQRASRHMHAMPAWSEN